VTIERVGGDWKNQQRVVDPRGWGNDHGQARRKGAKGVWAGYGAANCALVKKVEDERKAGRDIPSVGPFWGVGPFKDLTWRGSAPVGK